MSTPTTREVLRLYRDLLRYGKQLKFTDVKYYNRRIRTEFHENKTLESAEDIEFNFQVSFTFNLNRLISVEGFYAYSLFFSLVERKSSSEK